MKNTRNRSNERVSGPAGNKLLPRGNETKDPRDVPSRPCLVTLDLKLLADKVEQARLQILQKIEGVNESVEMIARQIRRESDPYEQ